MYWMSVGKTQQNVNNSKVDNDNTFFGIHSGIIMGEK